MNYSVTKNAIYYTSISDISEEIWSALDCERNLYYNRNFLESIEENHPEITFFYIVLVDDNKKPKAFASIQIVDFYFETVKNDLESLVKKIKEFGEKLRFIPKRKPLKLLICGNTFVSGEHGVFVKNHVNKNTVIKEVAKAILNYVNQNKTLTIDAFLLKDFKKKSLSETSDLVDFNYHPFSVEPNMVLNLNKNWVDFGDYLSALKTKFRVKTKRAFELSSSLEIKQVTSKNINSHLPKMADLYKKVTTNATFNLGDFNLETYKGFVEKLGDNYILKTFWLKNEMVGFMSGIINQNNLDAHFVGINYDLNRTHAVYQRMLYHYIEIAIDKKIKTLNFGRTASEIKSSVGAEPEDLTMYLRHKKSITNKILKLFLQRVQPTPFRQNFPLKKTSNEKQ